jgi:hypothetical protein
LDEFPRELTWKSVALNDHTESISGKLFKNAELIVILKQARYVIAGVVIKRYINPIAVVDSSSVCAFGHNHNGEAFVETDYVVVDGAVLVAEVMVGFDEGRFLNVGYGGRVDELLLAGCEQNEEEQGSCRMATGQT